MIDLYRRTLSDDRRVNQEKTLSVCTFNILAPCYKRLSSESDRESSHDSLWQCRHMSIIDLLQSLDIHLICLQEFWFKNIPFVQLYKSHLSPKYSFYSVQRTGALDDGLVILVDHNQVKVIKTQELILNDIGNRVGLLLHLEYRGEQLLLINVHLTFPHHRFEYRLRLKQMKRFLHLINEYQRSNDIHERCSIILCGDFNSPFHTDPVYQLLGEQFLSCYRSTHGHEPHVTHLTHRNEEVGVDFIFYQSKSFQAISTDLIPRGCDQSRWHDHTQWTLSDHRALLTTFQFNDNE